MKLYALTTASGTACVETTLSEDEYNDPEMRRITEEDRAPDVTLRWAEVTDNQVCQEWHAEDVGMRGEA